MGFSDTLLANLIPAVTAASVAAGLAFWFAKKYTKRWEDAQAERDRDAATSAEFYRAYGAFFAAWKSWDDHRTGVLKTQRDDRVPFLNRAADAEGALESFLIRLTQERDLLPDDLDRLWCFRVGYKQLRYSVRKDQRLPWWRAGPEDSEGVRQYKAFKRLAVGVAALLRSPHGKPVPRPDADDALERLVFVTGPLGPSDMNGRERWAGKLKDGGPLWVAVANALPLPSTTGSGNGSSASSTHGQQAPPSASSTNSLAGTKQDLTVSDGQPHPDADPHFRARLLPKPRWAQRRRSPR